ncbi:MAG: hypothetical protein ACM3XM_11145, partial [Mycobacterium leprae]
GFGLGLTMPLITLGVQQAFNRSKRGVVTSATSFFRSIGSTVGVTVFGVIFNSQMSHQFTVQMAPKLKLLPPAMAAAFGKIAEKPSDLVQVLLQKPLQEMIPTAIRGPVLDAIKLMMADSIHPVFWAGLFTILVGALVGQFLGRESLMAQIARHEGEDQPEAEGEPEAAFVGH